PYGGQITESARAFAADPVATGNMETGFSKISFAMICNFDVKTSSPYGMADDLAACSTTEKISKSTPDVLSLAKFIISLSKQN
ncbi:MAG: hypothetical protein VX376_05680, partial [Pseudomonadota bacterium]|nr:hypothetical protein [Pseudomonadota bacterium]